MYYNPLMTSKILQRLSFHNPWWQATIIPPILTPTYHRQIFTKLLQYLELNRIIILKGPRRTGKSTLLYQLMQHLHKTHDIPFKRFCYISFDDPMLRLDLLDILRVYEQEQNVSLNDSTTTYIFLDEVHALPHWSSLVKLLFDKKLNIKIIISDSSASLLTHQSESLAGRTIEEVILPLSFSEWTHYHKTHSQPTLALANQQLFNQYLSSSGFMHLLDVHDPILRNKMLLEDIVTKAIYKDSVEIFGLREPAILEKLFSYLATNSSGLANISKLSSMLGVDRTQTSKYLSFLENTYLIFSLSKYSPLIRKSIRSQPKIHLIDQGFSSIFATPQDSLYESVVARHLYALYGNQTYFWRDRTEVDLVITLPHQLLPIEIKNTTTISQKELSGLITFTNLHSLNHGLVLYNGQSRSIKLSKLTINFIPTWEFLLNPTSFIPPHIIPSP